MKPTAALMLAVLWPAAGLVFGADSAPKTECSAMQDKAIPAAAIGLPTKGAVITAATLTAASPASGDRPFATPEYCELNGSIAPVDPGAPAILFRVSVPTTWNQKAWHVGGGGLNGSVPNTTNARVPSSPPNAPSLLAEGYAVYGSDSGHQAGGRGIPGRGSASPEWLVNQEAWMNFAYRQLKKTHDAAMQVLTLMYGSKAKVSYFAGSSQGGREALEVLSRYAADYDGAYATVPLAYFAGLLIDPTVKGVSQLTPGSWLPPAKAAVVRDEILRLCDSLDGTEDGVINNYSACQKRVDPTLTKDPFARIRCAGGADTGSDCLSDSQLATLGSFYAPVKFGYPLANGETDWPGWGAGMEGGRGMGGWLASSSQPDGNNPAAFNAGIGATAQKGRLGFSQDFNLLTLNFAKFQKQIQDLSNELDVREDWSPYLNKGGKLIMVTGASDYISNPRAQMRLYDRVVARNGKAAVEKSVRYYVMPNSGHGLSGFNAKGEVLPSSWDAAAALVNWVENGVTPAESVPLTRFEPRAPYQATGSRLMCRYPNYPKYRGSGDASQAAGYTCVAPR